MNELEREIASATEWLDQEQAGSAAIELPEPDEDYLYAGARLLSFWPVVNSRGATYEREDFSEDSLNTLLGKQVNLTHDKLNKVIGSIIGYKVQPDGIDIAMRIDREQANFHGLEPEDMRKGNYFSQCSLELTKDPDGSHFYAYDDGYNIKQSIPVMTGRRMGIRRTRESDPYMLQGMKVAERIKPARFTGVGLVPRPADATAQLYAVKADEGDEEDRPLQTMDEQLFIELLPEDYDAVVNGTFSEEHASARELEIAMKALTPGNNYADPGYKGVKKYPLDNEGHVRSAARFWGIASYRSGYTPEQQRHISAAIARAKKKYGIGDAEKADTGVLTLSDVDKATLEAKISELEGQLASLRADKETASTEHNTKVSELEARITALETDLAARDEKISGYEQEKAAAERATKIEEILTQLHAIHPIADEEREALREKAAFVCDNDGVIHELRAAQLEKKVAALEAAKAEAATEEPAKTEEPVKTEEKPTGDGGGPSGPGAKEGEKEQASAEDARQKLEPPATLSTATHTDVPYVPGKYI